MESLRVSLVQPFEDAVETVKAAFKDQGFGTLSDIDVQKTLQEKIGHEIESYRVLGVCNPHIAAKAIATEHEIGIYMPCTVLLHECEGRVHVRVQDPVDVVALTGNESLRPLMLEARQRLDAALRTLETITASGRA